MKVVLNIPENVADVFRDFPKITRKGLQERTGISEYHSKIYIHSMMHGKPIAYHETKIKPKRGETKCAFLFGDTQIPYQDDIAIERALDYGLAQNPDMVVAAGDIFDCYAISAFQKDPSRPVFGDEVKMSRDIFYKINEKIDSCKSVKEKVFIEGNHERRLLRELCGDSKKLFGLDVLKIKYVYHLNKMGWEYVNNLDLLMSGIPVFRIGKLPILHGHEVRLKGGQLINVARWYYLNCQESVMVFHYHKTQEEIFKKLDMEFDGAWCVACLCLTQDYAPFNRWNQGFAMIHWTADDYSVNNKKIIDGKVL